MKKIFLFLLVCTFSTVAIAQKNSVPIKTKLITFLTDYYGETTNDLREANTQYITKDIDHDGIAEIIVMRDNATVFILSNTGRKLSILLERTSPDEHFLISDDGFIISEMEKSYMNSQYVIKLKNSKIAETATMSMEHIEETGEDGEVEYDENVEQSDNYDKLQPQTELTYTYDLEGWKPLVTTATKKSAK